MKDHFHQIAVHAGLGLALLLVGSFNVFGCSMHQLPEYPRSIVSPYTYIVVGEVTGYTEPIVDLGNFRGDAIGLQLKVIEPIHIPHSNNKNIELFMFRHGSDCYPEVTGKTPPLGTRYWLHVYPSTLVANSSRGGNAVRIETNTFSKYGVYEEMFGYSMNAESEFDYKNELKPLVEKFRTPEMQDKRGWLFDFLYVETSKDLLRLSRVKTETERMRILERMLYCPDINYPRLFLSEVGNPLKIEERDPRNLLLSLLPPGYVYKDKQKKFSKREKELMNERTRLESSGELKLW